MVASTQAELASKTDFFTTHEFLIRRLHSLTGLVPVGAYMVVHLLVNASIAISPGTFQSNVHQIHSLGSALPFVEWAFIFLPIIFHAVFGVWIIKSGKSNTSQYKYGANWRYSLQRWTGVIAVVFIFTHVFHLHGWFHGEWWKSTIAEPLGMAQFKPYNAASSLAIALNGYGGYVWPLFYLVGIVACVYHFANGVWTMGITWGVWVTPKAQAWALKACAGGGAFLLLVGITALIAAKRTDIYEAKEIEKNILEAKRQSATLIEDSHKQSP